MHVVGFGTYDLSRHPRVGIVLDGLRERGADVVELNAPLGFSTAERVEMLGHPWLVYRLALRLAGRWLRLARKARRRRRRGPIDLVLVGYMGHFDVLLARLLFGRRTTIALDLMIFAADTARDRGVSGGLRLRLLDGLDRLAARASDLVLLDTDEHVELLAPAQRHKAVVVPVGAPAAWFAAGARATRTGAGPLRVAFFGLYTPLQGAVTIGAALALLADRTDIEVTMIGSGQDLEATRAAAGAADTRVRWVDWVDAGELPGVVAAHDACLGIFGTTGKATRVVPNKVYQAAAAGCAIVTSGTAPQRRAFGDSVLYVEPGDAAGLAAAITGLADDRAAAARLAAAAAAAARDRFTPSAIVEPLARRIDS